MDKNSEGQQIQELPRAADTLATPLIIIILSSPHFNVPNTTTERILILLSYKGIPLISVQYTDLTQCTLYNLH